MSGRGKRKPLNYIKIITKIIYKLRNEKMIHDLEQIKSQPLTTNPKHLDNPDSLLS
jgi:hypothetical protein